MCSICWSTATLSLLIFVKSNKEIKTCIDHMIGHHPSSQQIISHNCLKPLGFAVLRCCHILTACIVHQHINTSKLRHDTLHHGLHRILLPNITHYPRSVGTQLFHCLPQQLFPPPRQHDLCSQTNCVFCNTEPYSSASSRHYPYLILAKWRCKQWGCHIWYWVPVPAEKEEKRAAYYGCQKQQQRVWNHGICV